MSFDPLDLDLERLRLARPRNLGEDPKPHERILDVNPFEVPLVEWAENMVVPRVLSFRESQDILRKRRDRK